MAQGEKVPCSAKHDWRAVTTVKIGQPEDEYPDPSGNHLKIVGR